MTQYPMTNSNFQYYQLSNTQLGIVNWILVLIGVGYWKLKIC